MFCGQFCSSDTNCVSYKYEDYSCLLGGIQKISESDSAEVFFEDSRVKKSKALFMHFLWHSQEGNKVNEHPLSL